MFTKMKVVVLFWMASWMLNCAGPHGDWIYTGQPVPGDQAQLFAPDIMKNLAHSSPSFSPDGKEIYWSVVSRDGQHRKMYRMIFRDDSWSAPQPLFANDTYHYDQPFITHSGTELYFGSNRPDGTNDTPSMRIWKATIRDDKSLTDPRVVTGMWTPTLSRSNMLYFVDRAEGYRNSLGIYRANLTGDSLQKTLLSGEINRKSAQDWCPYISPDDRYLLFASDRDKTPGDFDIYVSFNKNGHWTEPAGLGSSVNTDAQERFPGLSADGRYLFFTRSTDIPNRHELYWISASVIVNSPSKK